MASPVQTGTVTLNAAFLHDIKQLSRELHRRLDRVHRMCSRPRMVECRPRALSRMLARLRDDLAMHFSLEEFLGYFDEPVEVAPWMSERANALRREHSDLYAEISRISELADSFVSQERLSLVTKKIPARFNSFFSRLKSHESREVDLIMESLNRDIGVGD